MITLEKVNKLIRSGEIILRDARNIEFCDEESIWDASFHVKEAEALRDKWNLDVLYFLDNEFGSNSVIYVNFRLHIHACNTLEEEIENMRNFLAVLYAERRHLRTRSGLQRTNGVRPPQRSYPSFY